MRVGRLLLVSAAIAVGVVAVPASFAGAAACTGNQVIQQAPYTCEGTKTDQGITVNAVLSVDATGRAQADYTLPVAANVPVAIALHSWIGIDTGPDIVVTGSIPAGSLTGQLVIPEIRCGQLDVKAIDITPGHSAGDIAGPYITWGENCQSVPTTTTIAPTSVAPTSVAPTSVGPTTTGAVSPTSANRPTSTLPHTGGGNASTPGLVALVAIAAGVALLAMARRWTA